jgi:putative flippase GtrA
MLQHATQLMRFATVGLICFLVSIAVLTGLHELAGVYYLLAYGAAFLVSSTLGYLLNSYFTFRKSGAGGLGVLRYMVVNSALLLLNGAALRLLVEFFHMWYLGAALLLAAINTPVSYLAHRLLSFRLKLKEAAADSNA